MIKQLSHHYMMEEQYPEQKRCLLPSINLPIYVPVHNFTNSLFSLLTASNIMLAENLLFSNPENPCYVPPRETTTLLGDINTGNAYYDYLGKIDNSGNDVIVPIMLFADGMQIDKNRCICQEPRCIQWQYLNAQFTISLVLGEILD